MFVIGGGEHDGFDVGMFLEHLLCAEIAGDTVVVEVINIFCGLIFRAGCDPVELGVLAQGLIIFACVTVGQGHHCDFYWFHSYFSSAKIAGLPFFSLSSAALVISVSFASASFQISASSGC